MKTKWNKISQPGSYDGVPMDAYHGDLCVGPSVSSTGLRKIFTESPAHYYLDSYLNPHRKVRADTEAFALGRASHSLLLSEDDFSTAYIVRPDKWDSWRTEAAKEWKVQQEAFGRTVLIPSQIEQIRGMSRALAGHPLIKAGLLNGEVERSLISKDEKTGVWLKARPDAIPTDSGDFADLKTSSEFGEDLDRAVSKYRYDAQAALTGMCYRAVFKRQMTSFSFVFVEKSPPHSVEVVTLSSEDIEQAEKDLRIAIDTFAWCLKTGNWFGPGGTQNDARFVHIPEWTRKNFEFRRFFLEREMQRAAIEQETRITETV